MTPKSLLIGSLLSVTGILPVAYGCYTSTALESPKKESHEHRFKCDNPWDHEF